MVLVPYNLPTKLQQRDTDQGDNYGTELDRNRASRNLPAGRQRRRRHYSEEKMAALNLRRIFQLTTRGKRYLATSVLEVWQIQGVPNSRRHDSARSATRT